MAFEEFKGKLDEPAGTGFVPFSGKLDAPASQAAVGAAPDIPSVGTMGNLSDFFPEAISQTPAAPDTRSTITRIGDFLRPQFKSVLETPVPPDEQQLNVERRLSYGAGPISQAAEAAADAVRSGEAVAKNKTVQKVARVMEKRGQPTFSELVGRARNPALDRSVRDAKAEEFRSAGEWAADTLSGLSQGAVGLVQLPLNIFAPSGALSQTLRKTQQELQEQESEVLKAQRAQLLERVQNEDGFFGKYFATVEGLVTNPALSISEAAKQVPNFLGIMGVARLGGALTGAAINTASRASPTIALAEAISGNALRAGATAAGTKVGGVTAAGLMAGGDAAGNTYQTLTDPKKTPMSVWKTNPDFQQLVAQGKTPKQAIEEIATAKARFAAAITFPLGLLGFMGAEAAILARPGTRAAVQAATPKGAAKIFGKEIVGEQLEEGGTQAGSNVASQTVNPQQSLTEGVPEAMATAAVTAAPFAGAAVARQALQDRQTQADPFAEAEARRRFDVQSYNPNIIDPTSTRRPAERDAGTRLDKLLDERDATGRIDPTFDEAPAVVPPAMEPVPGMMTDEDLAQPENVSVTPVTPVPPPTKAAESLPETPTVPPATTPKLFEPAPGEHLAQDMTVVAVPVKDLTLSKDVPQFKAGASDQGVVEPLSGKFTQEGVAPIAVWRRLDGSLEVISGRHRLDLAKRSGTELINAQVYDEAAGFDKTKAAILDAELNIRDEQGKVKDYVNYFKASGTDRETADAKGFLARTKGKRGFTIANQGSDALIAAINSDQIGDEAAYYVAINAPNDERLQGVGLKALMDGKSIQAATNMMQALKAIGAETDTTPDIFGYDDSLIKEAEEMAKIASKMQQSVNSRLSAITGASKNPAMAKAEGIDVRDLEAVKQRISELQAQKEALKNWSTNPELVAQIRAARGTPAPKVEPLDLKSPTIEDITNQEELRKKSETLNEQEQIRKESEAGSEQFKLQQEEGRQDSTSSLFDQPEDEPQTVAISPETERKEALEQLKRQLLTPVLPFQALRVGKTQILRPSPLTDAQIKEILRLASDALDLGMPAAVLGNIRAAGSTRMKSVGVMSANGDFMIGSQWKEASPAEKLQTLIHELGHSIDFVANQISLQADWSKANTELKNWYDASANKFKHPLAYPFAPLFKARVNFKKESFAQAFGYYFTSPVDLQKNAPEAYSQIQSIVERIQNGSQKARAAGTTERGTAAIQIQPSRAEKNTAIQPGASAVGTPISATERLRDTGAGKKLDYIDTRSQGSQFHGTSKPVNKLSDDVSYTSSIENFYGAGFYSTDAVDVGVGYSKKGKGSEPTLYKITEVKQPNLYNMEAPLTPEIKQAAEGIFDLLYTEDNNDGTPVANLRELYDAVRQNSAGEDVSASEVNAMFEDMVGALVGLGYRGYEHTGGLKTSTNPHLVKIYWFPQENVRLTEVDPSDYLKVNQDEDGRLGNFLMNIEKPKKLPPGRTPELAEAAKQLKAGEITKEDFDALVNKYRPVVTYDAPLQPATDEQVFNALDVAKRAKINPPIAAGYPVGLRLDIPAYNRGGVFVVSIHEKRTPSAPGKVIGYSSVAEIKNVTFGLGNQKEALEIATGKSKDAIQTMEGSFVPTTPAEALAKARSAFKSGDYVQIGIDPTRHAYFFDRSNTQPVTYADEILQIGNMILGKGVRYGNKKDFLFNLQESKPQTNTPEFKRFFGSSKVVNKNGNPLVVYHGSPVKGITKFDTTRVTTRTTKGDVAGTYFTSDRMSAASFTRELNLNLGVKKGTPRGDITEAYLRIENPLNTTAAIKKYQKQGMTFGDAKRKALEALTPENDGIIFNGDSLNPSEYVVFKDTQIKSATGNRGTFDDSGNINENVIAEPSLAEQDEKDFIFGSTRIREEQIKEYAALRAKLARIPKKVAEGEVDLSMQRSVARLMQQARDLNSTIKATKPRLDSAEKFLAKAAIEFDKGNISEDVFKVIKAAYDKRPELLEGLLLSVKAPAGTKGTAGQFMAVSRVVRLFKNTSGTTDPVTIQHELAHSLEQMMLPEQRLVVAQAWVKGLLKAIKNNPDEKHQKYFQAVMDFIDNPNTATNRKALDLLPSYEMYQYINPSEFWAVNAQNLMAAELGTAWDKFKRAIARLWEGVKNVFGFDNRYAVQKMFKDVMNGSKERITKDVLADFVNNAGIKSQVLENIEDDKKLLEKYNRPNTPQLDQTPIKTQVVNAGKLGKDFFTYAVSDPLEALGTAANSVDRAILFARIKNIFFGAGLNAADFAKYNGELVTSQGLATSSVALDNAIRGGQIATEVIFQGGIDFNQKSRNFVAVKRDKGMAGVYEAEIALKKRLGDQLGTDIIQGYLEAKRSRSIQNEYFAREVEYEFFENDYNELQAANAPEEDIMAARDAMVEAKEDLKAIELVYNKIRMADEEIDAFIARDAAHPELRKIMQNWSAINQNMLAFWRQVGLLSQKRYESLSNIKDYVPWQRIMNDETDVHSPAQTTNRKMTNIGLEKLFKKGTPTVITDVVAKEGQQTFKIQPATVLEVEINGEPVAQDKITATADGQVKLDVPVTEGDLVVFKASREIENIIDNMTRNVMRMTMNGLRQGAAQRIVMEYATRDKKGKIMMFPKADKARGRFDFIVNGKRVVVEIQDPLIAESIFGMESLDIAMLKPLAAVANFTRRTITLSGVFQLKQVFKDAPTAALVTGVKRPLLLMGGIYKGFVTSLLNTDPTVQILKSAGIGGFQSAARTPEAEVKRRLGIMNRNVFDFVIKGLDHIGDASDMAQRVGVYKRVLAETGNETQALYQAANVINFLHHGSGQVAQAIVKTVPFAGAYANSMDVLIQALAGGGLKGRSRANALARLAATGTLLMGISLLYCFLVGDDEEYNQMDDQTKLRNFMIPGTKILLPMNTSAAYFFKAVPEMIYNKIIKEGTKNAVDERRLRTALKEAAIDMLLGPTPVPSGAKQVLEIGLNKDFFTGRPVVPESLAKLEAAERYTTETSEAGKFLSGLTGTKEKRILDPMEADHLIRGIFGTAGAMAQWFSNSIAVSSGDRPAMTDKQQPITGSFLRADVGRRNEDLFYDFKEEVDKRYGTYSKMLEREDDKAADAYEEKHSDILDFYKDVNKMDSDLKEINAEIRYYGEGKDTGLTPVQRREEIKLLQLEKQEMLDDIIEMRKEAGM